MASTASEASLDSNSATEDSDEFHDGSETLSMEARDYRDQDADGYSRRESFLSKTSSSFKASVHSTGKFIAKTLSKASSKSYREKRRKMKAMEGRSPSMRRRRARVSARRGVSGGRSRSPSPSRRRARSRGGTPRPDAPRAWTSTASGATRTRDSRLVARTRTSTRARAREARAGSFPRR